MSELLQLDAAPTAEASAPLPSRHYVRLNCECGKRTGATLGHYDLCECVCGRVYWALRPKRNGVLVAFHWPGNFITGPK